MKVWDLNLQPPRGGGEGKSQQPISGAADTATAGKVQEERGSKEKGGEGF